MNLRFNLVGTFVVTVALSGCSGPSSITQNIRTGATMNSLAGVPGAGMVGLAAHAVDLATSVFSSDSGPGSTRGKQFVMSKKLSDSFSNDGEVMRVVMDSQEKFKNKEWGDISGVQLTKNSEKQGGKGSVGRYPIPGNPALIISDEGETYKSFFENESSL